MITELAQAVADALNAAPGGTFSQDFTAARVALPEFSLEELRELRVTIVPREIESEMLDRSRDQHDVKVDVAIQQKLAAVGNEEVDPLLALVREIAAFFSRRTVGGAFWKNTANVPVYSPEHLREKRVFTSVLTLTYRIVA